MARQRGPLGPFFGLIAPELRAAGWRIDALMICHRCWWRPAGKWAIEESDDGWFDVSLGVEVTAVGWTRRRCCTSCSVRTPAGSTRISWTRSRRGPGHRAARDDGDRVALPPSGPPIARNLVDLFDTPSATPVGLPADAPPPLREVLGEGWRADGLASPG